MAESIPQSQEKNSKVYTLYYAFFLIPLMITIFGVMFFFMFKVLTYESNSPYEYLTNVQIGSATKRWQSAYELSKLLSALLSGNNRVLGTQWGTVIHTI